MDDPEKIITEDKVDKSIWARQLLRVIRETVTTIIPAIILALLVMHFVAQAKVVHGQSMEPNLHTGQRLIVEKISYHFYEPKRGDIIIINVPDSELPLIKRLIGLPGETVAIQDGQLFINGQLFDEPYLPDVQQHNYPASKIPENHLFVMGDNRLDSRDSRTFGPVHISQIEGHAWLSFWPLEELGPVK